MGQEEGYDGADRESPPDGVVGGSSPSLEKIRHLMRAAMAWAVLFAAGCHKEKQPVFPQSDNSPVPAVAATEQPAGKSSPGEEQAVSALDCENVEWVVSALDCENGWPATFLRGFEDIPVTEEMAKKLAEVGLPKLEQLWRERQKKVEAIRNDRTSSYLRHRLLDVKNKEDNADILQAAEKIQKDLRDLHAEAEQSLEPEIVRERFRWHVERKRDGTGEWEAKPH